MFQIAVGWGGWLPKVRHEATWRIRFRWQCGPGSLSPHPLLSSLFPSTHFLEAFSKTRKRGKLLAKYRRKWGEAVSTVCSWSAHSCTGSQMRGGRPGERLAGRKDYRAEGGERREQTRGGFPAVLLRGVVKGKVMSCVPHLPGWHVYQLIITLLLVWIPRRFIDMNPETIYLLRWTPHGQPRAQTL